MPMLVDPLRNSFNDLKMYARFCLGLRKYLRQKLTFREARETIKARMRQREENFLKIVKKGIFGYKRSPYLALLKLSGYEYKDIEKLVNKHGLEEALRILKDDGVYIKIEEFKARAPIIRKGRELMVRERDFDNPYISACYQRQTGATRSAGTRVMADFDFLSETAVYSGVTADMWGLSDMPFIMLRPLFPFGPGCEKALYFSKFNIYPRKWISLINEKSIPLSLKTKIGVSYILYMSRLWGAEFPVPDFIDLKDIGKVVEFIDSVLKENRGCFVSTNVSCAVRVCLAAHERGVKLKGVTFIGGSEPLTHTRKGEIESSGARFIVNYSFTEVTTAASCCLDPCAPDDMHFFRDFLAVIAHQRAVADSSVDAFLFTTLLPSAPKILLNVENGDYGIIEKRNCGCPYDDLGFDTHIRSINSFEKLKGEGMTFYNADIIRIIEEMLPAKFGGSSLDYQFIEEEDARGFRRLNLLVDPKIGNIDENMMVATVLDELGRKGDSQRVMAKMWSQAGTIKVRRDSPILTRAGKLYPLHILKNKE